GVEAMVLGVVPIFFHNPNLYDLSVMYSLEDAALFATNGEELASALHAALKGNVVERLKPHWEQEIRSLFGPLDSLGEQRLIAFMQEAGERRRQRSNAVA